MCNRVTATRLEELIKKYFHKKYKYEEICGILKTKHNIKIFLRTLKTKIKGLNLKRKN